MNVGKKKFVVGFHIDEANLGSLKSAIDPLCIVTCCGREFTTDVKRQKLRFVKFDDGTVWGDITATEDEFAMATIKFRLEGANAFWRNDHVGTASVQLAMVRQRPNHSFHNELQLQSDGQWSAKLKVSVYCYSEGEKPPGDLKDQDIEDAGEDAGLDNALLNAGINTGDQGVRNSYHLFVHVHRAEHLGGDTPKFVTVEFNQEKLASDVVKVAKSISFDLCFKLPVTLPLFVDAVVIRVWEKGSWGRDNLVVQGRLSFSLLRMHALPAKWFNFYGFSSKEVGDIAELYAHNEAPEENHFLGRLLISARVQRVPGKEKPEEAKLVAGECYTEPITSDTHFLLDIVEVSGCPGDEVFVELAVGADTRRSKTVKRKADGDDGVFGDPLMPGRFIFNEKEGKMPPLTAVVPTDAENQFDVILSIYARLQGGVATGFQDVIRVGFARLKMKDVMELRGAVRPPQWICCSPMAHLPSGIEPGAMLVSLSRTTRQAVKGADRSFRPLKFDLRVYVMSARNLLSSSGEVPLAECHLSCAGKTKEYVADHRTASPWWGKCATLPITLQCDTRALRAYPEPLHIVVYDKSDVSLVGEVNDAITGIANMDDDKKKKKKKKDKKEKKAALFEETAEGKAQKWFEQTGEMLKDMALAGVTGDMMAKKRLGAGVQGKRVIGRVQVSLKKLLRPPFDQDSQLVPQWLKLRGGVLGKAEVGDLLVYYQLMKQKYATKCPQLPTEPPRKEFILSTSVLGLRELTSNDGEEIKNPKIHIGIPSYTGSEDSVNSRTTIEWKKKPDNSQLPDDFNRKYKSLGKHGFEIFSVQHQMVELPRIYTYEPMMLLSVTQERNGLDADIGEGRVSLIKGIPGASFDMLMKAVEAHDKFVEDPAYIDSDASENGLRVSDLDDDGSQNKAYIFVTITDEKISEKVRFDEEDNKIFPPMVTARSGDSAVAMAGVGIGDWLVSYKTPSDAKEMGTATWTSAQAAKWAKNMDAERVRPLSLKFRTKANHEVPVRLQAGPANLSFVENASKKPPQIARDGSPEQIFSKKGILPGWRIADINGVDCENMSYDNPTFKYLLEQMRPAVITCCPLGGKDRQAEEKAFMKGRVVNLNGVPTPVMAHFESKLYEETPALYRGTCIPRPCCQLPPVHAAGKLICRAARAGALDVRGRFKQALAAPECDDDADTHNRASVQGPIEEFIEQSLFTKVPIFRGTLQTGAVRMRWKVVPAYLGQNKNVPKEKWPTNFGWYEKLPREDPDFTIFEPGRFRKKYKIDQPHVLRLRSYILRGLNVSGAISGYGKPYLFLKFGEETVRYPSKQHERASGWLKINKREEKDIKFPEQATFEVGLLDWVDGADADMPIGSTTIDLEERWYNSEFQLYMRRNKMPVEYRPLECPTNDGTASLSRGSLEMWVEMLTTEQAAECPASALTDVPDVEVEARVILWDAKKVSLRLCVDDRGAPRPTIPMFARCSVDCQTYKGPPDQQNQMTDTHFKSAGEAEFNWRFIFPNIAVARGGAADCYLTLSLWEHTGFSTKHRPLGEATLEMKHYCKRVARSGDPMQIEGVIPLVNPKLQEQLEQEAADNEDENMFDDLPTKDFDQNGADSGEGSMAISGFAQGSAQEPAGYVKVLVQVYTQVQASSPGEVVGIARGEPNRNPVLSFPRTGRDWRDTFEKVDEVLQYATSAFNNGRRRCKILACLATFVLLVVGICMIPGSQDCRMVQKSCLTECRACGDCFVQGPNAQKSDVCYWFFSEWFSNFPEACLTSAMTAYQCNEACQGDAANCMDERPLKPRAGAGSTMR